jgi:hypothetical protein
MMKRVSYNMLLVVIIVFSSMWATYLIIDNMCYEDVPRNMLHIDYGSKFLFAFDGSTSFIEDILFGMVCPVISASMMIDYLWRHEKDEIGRTCKEHRKN